VHESFEALGVPKPTSATDAFEAFKGRYGREPTEAECEHWMVR
jgi:hypothetical protein